MTPVDNHEKINGDKKFSRGRRDRLVWLLMAALFLSAAVLALGIAVRTRADGGSGLRWWEHHMEESDGPVLPLDEGLPAALLPAYPSPFRTETEEDGHLSAEEGTTAGESVPESVSESPPPSSDPPRKREEMIYHSHPNDRMEIALTFDDGPHPRLTPIILDILEEYGIKATFFMVGENVGYYPAAARAVAEAGHEIGNHTFSHRKFDRMGEEELLREIASCESAIAGFSESPVRLIRPPEGQMSDTMGRVIGSLDYRVILWDVDTRDWAHTPPETITRHILDTVKPGDIILMHDFIGYDSPTPEALRRVIPALLERGYRFVTVGELMDGD